MIESAASTKVLQNIPQKNRINIEFQDLTYSVKDFNAKEGKRQILKSINGNFSSGQLTGILGVSGAGKTSLLNVLAGYIISGVEGHININNEPRDLKKFYKISSYIMQENIVQPFLTVKESMMYAAGFKLGQHFTHKQKIVMIEEVLSFLGLEDCLDTPSKRLSGGERKRFTVALELVNDPPVMFLDEPTTGLDYSATKQCVDLMKKLTNLGKTVVCTIHQPSSSLLNDFDQLYVMADGYCVYNDYVMEMVPFLSLAGYACPSNSTPIDHMIELIHLCPSTVEIFKTLTENGKLNVNKGSQEETFAVLQIENDYKNTKVSFYYQVYLLLSRMLLQKKRNKLALCLFLFHHFFGSGITASIFGKFGNNASKMTLCFKYVLCCITFTLYTYLLIPVLAFPFEREFLKIEKFNNWYSLEAYFIALTVVNLPFIVIFMIIFSSIVYFCTDQPMEIERIIGFFLISYCMALTSQSFGYLIGALWDGKKGAVIGSVILGSSLILSGYGLDFNYEINTLGKFLLEVVFARNGTIGFLNVLFYGREPMACNEEFCLFTKPAEMLRVFTVSDNHYTHEMGKLLIFYVVFQTLCYVVLKCRLNTEIYMWFIYYGKKIDNVIRIVYFR